jgi:riboflavin synthase
MFTGIIQAIGEMARMTVAGPSAELTIKSAGFWDDVKQGDSIAVDGVCLTAKRLTGATCMFDVSKESLDRSIIGGYRKGAKVNLEKALRPIDRLGGHIVQGHVDGVGRYAGKKKAGEYVEMEFMIPPNVSRYSVEKGSIAINGISLTIAKIKGNRIKIALIPHTLKVTNLSALTASSPVNLECDIIAKYAEKLLAPSMGGGMDSSFLKGKGFN